MLTVAFQPPVHGGGSPISAYRVRWDQRGLFAGTGVPPLEGEALLEPSARYFTLTRLRAAATQYHVGVAAVNGMGEGRKTLPLRSPSTLADRE